MSIRKPRCTGELAPAGKTDEEIAAERADTSVSTAYETRHAEATNLQAICCSH